MLNKKKSRIRRGKRARAKIKQLAVNRLCIHRTAQHMYAQIISPCGSKVLVSASTLEAELRDAIKGNRGNKEAAAKVGATIAKRALEANIKEVAFDRSGFKYHGRVAALADAAREAGMRF